MAPKAKQAPKQSNEPTYKVIVSGIVYSWPPAQHDVKVEGDTITESEFRPPAGVTTAELIERYIGLGAITKVG